LNHVYIPRTTQTCTTHCCHLSNYTTYKKTSKHTAMKKRDELKSLLYHIHYVPKTSCPEMEMDIFMYRSIPNVQINTRRMFVNSCTNVIIITLFYTYCTRGFGKNQVRLHLNGAKKFLLKFLIKYVPASWTAPGMQKL